MMFSLHELGDPLLGKRCTHTHWVYGETSRTRLTDWYTYRGVQKMNVLVYQTDLD